MALNIKALVTAIEEHTETEFNLEAAGRNSNLPYVIWELLSSRPDHTNTGVMEIVQYRITVFDRTSAGAQAIHATIAGSFDESTLTITGYTGVRNQRVDSSHRFDRGTWQSSLTYQLWAEKD